MNLFKLLAIISILALSIVLVININSLIVKLEEKNIAILELQAQVNNLEYEKLVEFSSVEELTKWLEEDTTNYYSYERRDFNCIDFALLLQQNALKDGYLINIEVLPIGAHYVNSVVIDDVLYVIEPQNDQIIVTQEMKHDGEE